MKNKISIICTGGKKTFIELVKSIEDSIEEISDYETHWLKSHTKNEKCFSDINIIVHGRYLNTPKNSLNILIQTEQLNNLKSNEGFCFDNYNAVLDLFPSKNNTYLPLGYSKYFDNYEEKREDINFLFFGGPSDRRFEIINKYLVFYKRILFGQERDDLINRTKWNINIKNETNWHYTPLRGILVMSKGKIFLQEELNNKEYGYHEPYLIKFNEDNLLEIADEWNDQRKRKEFGMYIKESLMKKPFKEIFLKKLNEIGIK